MLIDSQLIGGCPVVAAFASNRHSRDIRLEAALFIGSVCRTSLLTVAPFFSLHSHHNGFMAVLTAADVYQFSRSTGTGGHGG